MSFDMVKVHHDLGGIVGFLTIRNAYRGTAALSNRFIDSHIC